MNNINVLNLGKTIAVQVAPGKTVVSAPSNCVPTVGIFKLQPIGGSEYRAIIEPRGNFVRLSPSVLKQYGLGIEYRTLRRLISAGFVEGQRIAPGTWQFSLSSYFEHLERTRNDPDFWSPEHPDKNYQRYQSAI